MQQQINETNLPIYIKGKLLNKTRRKQNKKGLQAYQSKINPHWGLQKVGGWEKGESLKTTY